MSQCRILREYSIYVAKVRVFTEQMPVDAAVQKAVAECIHENILADFLRKNQAEVIAMSIFEYDKEEEEKKLRKAEFEAGVEHGIEQSLVSLVIKKMKKGNGNVEQALSASRQQKMYSYGHNLHGCGKAWKSISLFS